MIEEKPILMSASMVCATLDGCKTQTRRGVKAKHCIEKRDNGDLIPLLDKCPYGAAGHHLWVRENFKVSKVDNGYQSPHSSDDFQCPMARVEYMDGQEKDYELIVDPDMGFNDLAQAQRAIKKYPNFVPSIHMPRWASRIDLEINDIRVERLQDISDDDVLAEGIIGHEIAGWKLYAHYGAWVRTERGIAVDMAQASANPKTAFIYLWNRINGKDAWNQNPWVWVVDYKRIRP